jgi:hypothetical protein
MTSIHRNGITVVCWGQTYGLESLEIGLWDAHTGSLLTEDYDRVPMAVRRCRHDQTSAC